MRTFLTILLIAGFSYLAHVYIPFWWFFAVVAFIISFAFGKSGVSSFFAGFVAIFVLWMVLNLGNSLENDFLLVDKMSNLVGAPHSIVLILISALIGGVVAAFSSLAGFFFKTFGDVKPKKVVKTTEVEETEVSTELSPE